MKTHATIIEPEIMDSIYVCINPPRQLVSRQQRIQHCLFFVLQLDFANLDGSHRDAIATHCSATGVLDNLVWLATMPSSLRLTLFKTPMMGKIFLSPRPPTQTNLAMCPNLVSY